MKRLATALGLAALLVSPVFAQEQGMTSGWADAAPTIDGVIGDGEWSSAMVVGFDGMDGIRPGVTGPDSGTIGGPGGEGFQDAADSSVLLYVMNDADNLYVAVDATDDVLDFSLGDAWRNDAVEVRVDGNFSRLTAKEGDILGHSTVVLGDGSGTASEPSDGDWSSAGAVKEDGSGWVIEYRTSTAGFASTIGFDVAINDSDDPANNSRDGQYRWNGATDGGWNDESQWGVLELATGPGVRFAQRLWSPEATAAPAIDGMIADGEWADALAIGFDGMDGIRPGFTGPDSGTIGGPGGEGFQDAADSSVIMYVMNDSDSLYVAIDSTDDVLDFSLGDVWRNDGVEVRVDGNLSLLTAKEGDIFGHSTAIRGDGGATASEPSGDWESGAAAKEDGSGWVIEYRTSIDGFSQIIGFDVAVNDSDDPGNDSRDGQYRWNGATDGGWNDETQWGTVVLFGVASGVDEDVWELY